MKKNLVIYGAGGLGREVSALLKALPEWQLTGYYDDGKTKGENIGNVPVLGGMNELLSINEETQVIIAIGNPRIKEALAIRMKTNSFIHFPVLIHPAAILQDETTIELGEGTVITAGVIITTQVQIGKHVLINLNATIGHDVEIGDCTSIMPGASIAGEVRIGNSVMIGSGSNILNGLRVADQSIIGAGAVVTKDVAEGTTVVGVPARVINTKSR